MARKPDKVDYIQVIKEAPSKNLDYIFISLTFIVAILLIVFAIKPTVEAVLTIGKEIKEKERIVGALNSKINALSVLDTQYNDNKDSFEGLTLIYPTSGNFSLFLSNIEAVIARNNFILESVGFSEYDSAKMDINASVLKPWSTRISVSGKRSNVLNLLKDLEAMPMYPVIESFSFSDKTDEYGNVRYSIQLRIYHIENNMFYE